MTTTQVLGQELDLPQVFRTRSRPARAWAATMHFARRKPLGAACGVVVLMFMIFGDLVPETINSATSLAGAGRPVPYMADLLRDHTGFVYQYNKQDLRNRLEGSSSEHLLGTDQIGRDVFSRILYGARVAVMVSFGAVIITELIASTLGIVSGYYRGFVDKVLYRFVDILQSLPTLIALIAILGIFGKGLWPMIIVIGVLGGPSGSRVIRSQTLSIMSSPFIEAARASGATDRRIMWSHVLPNLLPLIILSSTLRLGTVVLIEASLSFLGFGLPPPFPSWGQMLSIEGREYMSSHPGLAIYPGLAIGLLVFSYNLFGDALRDVLDPRLRGAR